jgi:hypothetical protein
MLLDRIYKNIHKVHVRFLWSDKSLQWSVMGGQFVRGVSAYGWQSADRYLIQQLL